MTSMPAGSFTATLTGLFEKGVRYGTVIDLGCADGHFFLSHQSLGIFPGALPLHVDPNPLYEDSLKAIKGAVGGHYMIAAASDRRGEVEMTTSAHPYWNSLRPQGDAYWERVNRLNEPATMTVKAVTLDFLAKKFNLAPPYLLKLDIQGAEVQALRGGADVLKQTSVVICEADIDDFEDINRTLVDAGFRLYDLTQHNWLQDHSLGWFYPVYLNRNLDNIRRRSFWDPAQNADVLKIQADRRKAILERNAILLAQQKALRGH